MTTSITPMLSVANAAEAIVFYQKAFAAAETMRMHDPGGKISHAEIRIGAAAFMLSDEFPEIGVLGPLTIGGSPVMLLLRVPDVDAAFRRAIDAGAVEIRAVAGDALRNGKLVDPFGHRWMIMTQGA